MAEMSGPCSASHERPLHHGTAWYRCPRRADGEVPALFGAYQIAGLSAGNLYLLRVKPLDRVYLEFKHYRGTFAILVNSLTRWSSICIAQGWNAEGGQRLCRTRAERDISPG